ncbi:phage tail tape measure protein [Streptomyces tauricus]|uniref:phage tail tape measure protein n=1 Tax=Streptomyces tauricus TaxID=68274 RepID=UPI00387F2056
MALTVGELTGTITLDPSGVTDGLNTAEGQMRRAGQQMGDDAQRAGQQAGQNLGDGVVRGADGRLRDLRGRFVAAVNQAGDGATTAARQAGDDAGQALGDGMGRQAEAGGGRAAKLAEAGMGMLKGAAAGIGLAAGAALMAGFTQSLEQGQIVGRLGAQLGATPAEAQRYGKIAGSLYANAVTEDFQTAADAISAVMRAGIAPPGATNAQLESIATKVADLASTFELDLGQTANAVGQMIKTGLAKDGVEAVDALTRGLQVMGPRADDIGDTFNEYSTIFRQMGISATDATGLLSQGMKAGARDTDVVADSLKEFVLIAQAGGKDVDAAFSKIGLSGKEMQAAFTKGGPEAKAALDKVFDGLRQIKDPAERSAIALALFGTKSEDTQKALMALDPSEATKSLGEFNGAADRMGDSLRDNAGARITQFQRTMQQGLVDFIGGPVLGSLSLAKTALGSMWDDAGKGGQEGANRVAAFLGILGTTIVSKIREFAPKAVAAIAELGQKMADYVMANPVAAFKIVAIGSALLIAFAALPAIIAAGISAAAVSLMVGFVGRMLSALNENLPRWWASFQGWISSKAGTVGSFFSSIGSAIGAWFSGLWSRYISGPVSRQWASLMTSVQGLGPRSVAALSALGRMLASAAASHWGRFKAATVQRVADAISYIRSIPGRARSALGNLGGVLAGAGRALIQGFINGIKGMIGSVRSAASSVVSAARDYFPFSPAKKGPFSGRGYTSYSGRALVSDFAKSIDANSGMVDRSMQDLMSTPTPTASMAMATSAAVGANSATTKSIPTVRLAAGDELGDWMIEKIRERVGIGGGDVQVVLSGRR